MACGSWLGANDPYKGIDELLWGGSPIVCWHHCPQQHVQGAISVAAQTMVFVSEQWQGDQRSSFVAVTQACRSRVCVCVCVGVCACACVCLIGGKL